MLRSDTRVGKMLFYQYIVPPVCICVLKKKCPCFIKVDNILLLCLRGRVLYQIEY